MNKLLEEITIPIYFIQRKKNKIIIDIESITDEFNEKLSEIIKNPKNYLEI